MTRRPARGIAARLLLLALLFMAHVGAFSHALKHVDEERQGLTPHQTCVQCVSYGHLAGFASAPAAPPVLSLPAATAIALVDLTCDARPQPSPYLVRGPPAYSQAV